MFFRLCLLVYLLSLGAAGFARALTDDFCDNTISVHCGATPSALWHQDKLWVVFVQDQHVYLTHSNDWGKNYSPPIPVNAAPEVIETNGENRPKLAATAEALLVSWTQKTDGRFTGDIRFSRSIDGGKTFDKPRTINDDGLLISHRFDSLLVTPEDRVYLTWLDKRDKVAAEARGEDYTGSAVYVAVSEDQGRTFSRNTAVAHNSCECCRIALAPAHDGGLAVFWRHVFGQNTRDHGFALVAPDGKIRSVTRATRDEWQIDACPHHGPDLAPAAVAHRYHLAWFSDGDRHQGIYYGRHNSRAAATTAVRLMDDRPSASHPQVVEHRSRVYFAWKHFDGQRMQILVAVSNDGGNSWSEPRSVAATAAGSDHPSLVAAEDALYLAWHTQAEGFRLVPLNDESQAEQTQL